MTKRFIGKSVLVTGAASGIARATALRLASEGADLALADINLAGVTSVAEEARKYGIQATALTFDAADAAACHQLVADAVAALGKLDVVCNIAGILDRGPTAKFADAAWDRVLNVNLASVFRICKSALPHLLKTKGNIVNMASAAALVGIPFTAAYCASKAGVVALTKSIGLEYAEAGVRANAVCPGGVRTPLIAPKPDADAESLALAKQMAARHAPKIGRLAEPEEIAAAVAYLASDEAAFVTGVAFAIDGGQVAG